jgi:serpin B
MTASLALAGCTSSSDAKPKDTALVRAAAPVSRPTAPQADLDATAAGSTAFGLDLFHAMASGGDGAKNMMISPASLTAALGMLLPGARGKTADEITKVLHTSLPADKYAVAVGALNAASAQRVTDDKGTLQQFDTVWTQKDYGIQQQYLDTLSSAFDTGVHQTDFAKNAEKSRQDINKTVEGQTNGLIKDLFPQGSLDDSTRLVLTDALYFKAKWADTFKSQLTADRPFHLLDGTTLPVSTMAQNHSYDYASGTGWQYAELPYAGSHLSMGIVLPDAGTFPAFRDRLDAASLASMIQGRQPSTVDLELPKFTFDSGATLNEQLKALGMPTVFNPNASDLGNIPKAADQLYVSIVTEKTHVAVDEDGTTAAAAAGVGVSVAGAAILPHPVTMHVDRPFLFLVRDTVSGQVLFLGQVTNPKG